MDYLPLCNLLQVGWGALCPWNKGSECKTRPQNCTAGKVVPPGQPLLLQGPFLTSIPGCTSGTHPLQSPHVVHPAQNQGQEFQIQLQKLKQAHYRRGDLLEQIAKYCQDTDANSNKEDWAKRRWTVKLATLILNGLERFLPGPLHWATLTWNSHPQYRLMHFHAPRNSPIHHSILILKPLRATTKRELPQWSTVTLVVSYFSISLVHEHIAKSEPSS